MQAFVTNIFKKSTIFSGITRNYHATQKPFAKIGETDLVNSEKIRELLRTKIPKHNDRTLKGIFHGKKPKSGNKYCYSDKATRRSWKPNAHDKTYYSEVLKRKINIEVTTKAMRCMRKYGGFDNYILLTKPQNLDSLYGEYLRKLMLTKLNNPEFETPYIVKSAPIKFRAHRKYYKFSQIPTVFVPKDQRYVDNYLSKVRNIDEMTKEELKLEREMEVMSKEFQDVQITNPVIVAENEKIATQMKLLEKDRAQAIANFEKLQNKKAKALVKDMNELAQQEGFIKDIRAKSSKK